MNETGQDGVGFSSLMVFIPHPFVLYPFTFLRSSPGSRCKDHVWEDLPFYVCFPRQPSDFPWWVGIVTVLGLDGGCLTLPRVPRGSRDTPSFVIGEKTPEVPLLLTLVWTPPTSVFMSYTRRRVPSYPSVLVPDPDRRRRGHREEVDPRTRCVRPDGRRRP